MAQETLAIKADAAVSPGLGKDAIRDIHEDAKQNSGKGDSEVRGAEFAVAVVAGLGAGVLGKKGGEADAGTTRVESVVPKGLGNFADDAKLLGHFEKHGAEFGAKSADEYLSMARDVMQNGTKVQYVYKGETRTGYVQLMGNTSKGQSKFAFVGTNSEGKITTLHTKSGKDFWKTLNGSAQDKTIYLAQ